METIIQVGGDAGMILSQVGSHPQILGDREIREDHPSFGDMAETTGDDPVGRLVRDVSPIVGDAARSGSDEPGDRPQERRLAGPVGADKSHDGTVGHLQRDPVQRANRPVGNLQIGNFKHLPPPLRLLPFPGKPRSPPDCSGSRKDSPPRFSRHTRARQCAGRPPSPRSCRVRRGAH